MLQPSHVRNAANNHSWSKSGRLLASGSDDTHLNIWSYNPDGVAKPFTLSSSVSTGHTQNVFSVKFMPHSNDSTIVTCAGDSQVRVFDIERGGNASTSREDAHLASTRSRRFMKFFTGCRFLNDANTNARVYRSHADRAKRVVTESSPHLFLTCSEDGEVRQWDLRQPSAAYPAPRGGQGYMSYRSSNGDDDKAVPPPLISYKRYAMDLNSISCSSSQPHYIALGGAHLHCFLHDRRMLGRDLDSEKGQNVKRNTAADTEADETMSQATRCVRRFAPHNKRRMGQHDNGHITACKISDANPNELIASWSGDHIYSFDIVKSPDAREAEILDAEAYEVERKKLRNERRRNKRKAASAVSTASGEKARLKRTEVVSDGDVALRVRYGNGETEDLSINPGRESYARDALLTEAQEAAERMGRSLAQLRKAIFDFTTSASEATESDQHSKEYTNALGQAAVLLPKMDEVIREWTYPKNPTPEQVATQNTLRRNRQASWRFVQATGCLAKTMGGTLRTTSHLPDPRLGSFQSVKPAATEGSSIDPQSCFHYDLLKAVTRWLDGGHTALANAFIRPLNVSKESKRFLASAEESLSNEDIVESRIFPYLHQLAREDVSLIDLDSNRFEVDSSRLLFRSQVEAVSTFHRAVVNKFASQISDVHKTVVEATTPISAALEADSDEREDSAELMGVLEAGRIHDATTYRFWGEKVCRSLLMSAGEGINYAYVKNAFGGLRTTMIENGPDAERPRLDTDSGEDIEVDTIQTVHASANQDGAEERSMTPFQRSSIVHAETSNQSQPETTAATSNAPEPRDVEHEREPEDEDEDDNDASDQENENDSDEDQDGPQTFYRRRGNFGRSHERAKLNLNVPYSSHSRVYTGHCNTKTVKDVNYAGMNDEYVVSGSDDGHFFIWDKKTSRLMNILEGDGEVVNVVQGHPYEPIIACSGIDSTIKIFSPDAAAREDAANGINIANPPGGTHSSVRGVGGRRRRASQRIPEEESQETAEGLTSRKAMHKSYEIISQNDVQRRDGVGDAYITVSAQELLIRAWLLAGQEID